MAPKTVLTVPDMIRAVLVAAIYGLSFVAIEQAVHEAPPLLVTGYRFLFTALPMVFFIARPKAPLWSIIMFGLVQGAIMFGLIFTAISWGMPAGLASLVVQCQVFFTIAFSVILFRERPKPKQIIGALIAFLGMVVIGVVKGQEAPILPFLMVIASAAAWGAANIIAKKAKPDNMLAFICWSSLAAPLPLFAASTVIEGTTFGLLSQMPTWSFIASIAFLAIITTIIAFTWWVSLLNTYVASLVTPFALLIPIFGMASMAIVYGERITSGVALGALLVFIGLVVNVISPNKLKTRYQRGQKP